MSVVVFATGDADELTLCLADLLWCTQYKPLEILVILRADGSETTNPALRNMLRNLLGNLESAGALRVIPAADMPGAFAMQNLAVQQAKGEVVIVLHSGLRVSGPDWIGELLSHALRPDVGIVAPLLVGPGSLIASAGFVLGAEPPLAPAQSDNAGYYGVFALTREVSAVSSACFAFRRSVFLASEGLLAQGTLLESEIAFCASLWEAGLRVIITPYTAVSCSERIYSRLIGSHLPNARNIDPDRQEQGIPEDPFYNPNLSLSQLFSETSDPSRRMKPWAKFRAQILREKSLAQRAHTPAISRGQQSAAQALVGICGTFDVENYGDLLFPLIASAALARRNPEIQVEAYSVNAKCADRWPYRVEPLRNLPASVSALSALLIGGGQIIRFDKFYPVPVPPSADLPLDYWLTPAVLTALSGKPVIWNAVGAWTASQPSARHVQLLRRTFESSFFIGIRDAASRDHLAKIAPEAALEILPDTAFSLSRLWPLEEVTAEFDKWRTDLGIQGKYVVLQASAAVAKHQDRIHSFVNLMGGVRAVVLPVCWCHGDRADHFEHWHGSPALNRSWLPPRLLAEILGRSEFVFASSMHACITALSYGVPAARVSVSADRKYEMLSGFEGVASIDDTESLSRLLRRGRRIEPLLDQYADCLDRHWDDVARVVAHPPPEHLAASRSTMLQWVAQACGDRQQE